jgi:hypothetical protein
VEVQPCVGYTFMVEMEEKDTLGNIIIQQNMFICIFDGKIDPSQ